MAIEQARKRRVRLGLALFMGGAGAMHFVSPSFFDDVVPAWMPGSARTVTYVGGVAELACATLVVNGRTARLGGWATLALLVGVYPANVHLAIDAGRPAGAEDWVVWARLPLQAPLWFWAYRVARNAEVSVRR